jgi:hypothetical protein
MHKPSSFLGHPWHHPDNKLLKWIDGDDDEKCALVPCDKTVTLL